MININQARNHVEQKKGARKSVLESKLESEQNKRSYEKDLSHHEEAREIIREVGLQTQKLLQFHISDITSLALGSVYDLPYQLVAEFVSRRNKSECDLFFERDGNRVEPIDASGGGAVNIASFALRVAAWSMSRPRTNNLLILDEPLNNLDVVRMPRASEMLKQISKKLNLQLILITHSEELAEAADRTFQVSIHKGVSHVEEI
jgi:DNA repair exonuclease SbcCD ATPase subunit